MDLPAGFAYVADFLSVDQERSLLAVLASVNLGDVVMHGVAAKRKVAHFGRGYAYASGALQGAPPLPAFLLPLRERAAVLAELAGAKPQPDETCGSWQLPDHDLPR
jgi:hypothetical protein